MKVLLVEPLYIRKLPPLSLGKISTMHKLRGDNVKYLRGNSGWFIDYNPDIIYITSLFTWDYNVVNKTLHNFIKQFPNSEIKLGGICATLMKDKFPKENLHIGEWEELDNFPFDYSLFPKLDYSIGYTTRGCPNNCKFCMVSILEPSFKELNNWYININPKFKHLVLWDNNFLNASNSHIYNVLSLVKKKDLTLDFNQSLDIRLLNDEIIDLFKTIRFKPLRFSFDSRKYEKRFRKGMQLLKDKNYTMSNIMVFVLHGFDDTLEDAIERTKIVWEEYGAIPFAMRYQPLDIEKKNDYIPKNWEHFDYINFTRYVNQTHIFKSMSYERFKEKMKQGKKNDK